MTTVSNVVLILAAVQVIVVRVLMSTTIRMIAMIVETKVAMVGRVAMEIPNLVLKLRKRRRDDVVWNS